VSRILIVEDEPRVAAFLDKGLRASGFTTTVAADGDAALGAALSGQFDLLLLDLVLPGKHGFAVLSELRGARVTMPVIVLTARCGIDDTLAGLRGDRAPEVTVLRYGRLELDLRTRRARVGDRPVALSAREFLLAETFVRNAGQVLSRQQLLSHVWGYGHDPGSNVVDVSVCGLRRKLGPDAIQTVRGMGYRLGEV
jgi:two-component system, OmpR family, copper resistance phosphate regulon response regulator CusR